MLGTVTFRRKNFDAKKFDTVVQSNFFELKNNNTQRDRLPAVLEQN
jgi:hypothetical protein